MGTKSHRKFKEQIGYFEGVEEVLNLSALNDEDYGRTPVMEGKG